MKITRQTICLLVLGCAMAAYAQTGNEAVKGNAGPASATDIEQRAAKLKARPPQPAVGIVRTRTAGGLDLLSGGITIGDRAAMRAESAGYGLWVATVAKPSGAYLADVDLRIVEFKGRATVLERKMEGPWLFVALPEGLYEVSATFSADGADKPQTITTRVTVPKTGQRQAVLRFDSNANVNPEMQTPLKGNPFGGPNSAK
jgi:hypothetical protein